MLGLYVDKYPHLAGHQTEAVAIPARPRRPPNPVDVVSGADGKVEVHHPRHVGNVQPSGELVTLISSANSKTQV